MGKFEDPMDNLSIQEKLIKHQTMRMEKCFDMIKEEIIELRRAVTAGNVVERLAHMAGERREPLKVIAEPSDDWKSL
jgi:hypothetical protein